MGCIGNRRIAEHTGDCVKILDLEGRLVFMNREGLRILEVEAAHVLNRPIVDFFNGEMRVAAAAEVAEVRRPPADERDEKRTRKQRKCGMASDHRSSARRA